MVDETDFDDLPDIRLLQTESDERNQSFRVKKVLCIIGSVILIVFLSIFVVSMVLRHIHKQQQQKSSHDELVRTTIFPTASK